MSGSHIAFVALATLVGVALGAVGDRLYISWQSEQKASNQALTQEQQTTPPVGWNRLKASIVSLELFYPAQWGEPEENLTVRKVGRQYVLSFTNAPTIFAGSMTDNYAGVDRKLTEVAVSRMEKNGSVISLYLGEVKQYFIENYRVLKTTRAGEVGLGSAPPPGVAGFEAGDRVGIVSLAENDLRVLIFHFHKFATDQEAETLLESIEIR